MKNRIPEAKSEAPLTAPLIGTLPWVLLLLGTGIAVYYALPFETTGKQIAMSLAMVTLLWLTAETLKIGKTPATILLLVIAGLSAAHYRTHGVKTALLPIDAKPYTVGLVVEEAIPVQKNRIRYRGRALFLSNTPTNAVPKRLQVTTADQGPRFVYGDTVCLRAVLKRPPGPQRPGAYDYGWSLWFMKIGGTGYSISTPNHCKGRKQGEVKAFTKLIARVRGAIAVRLEQGLAPREQALARTIILGERGRISDEDLTALRNAGLGHLLAISGLHMAIFAGTLFFLIRAGLALVPAWAENFPIKKWAALAAAIGGLGYFLISGQSIPTQRAFIMITILFLAMIIERPALTMRNVVLAAIVIILMRPESLLQPGFQMSFAAVTGLIVSYELKLKYENHSSFSWLQTPTGWWRSLYYIFGICFTSLVATLATAPFAIYHFYQVSYMGPIGNMLAIPVFSLAIMPLAVLSLCLMPLGLEQLPLNILAFAIDVLLAIAHWTSSIKPAVIYVGAIKIEVILFLSLAVMIAIFAQGRQKLIALGLVAAAIIAGLPVTKADILINDKATLMALRGSDAKLYAPDGRRDRFTLLKWLRSDGDARHTNETYNELMLRCDNTACSGRVKDKRITLIRTIDALKQACKTADILIYKRTITRPCKGPALILTRQEMTIGGSHEIVLRNNDILVKRSSDKRRHRIWGGSE